MANVTFLGCGAGYNPVLGPSSAYFILGKTLYLLDCGTSVFERLAERGLFAGIDGVTVFLSHQHADHIGSLGILLDYCWDILGIRPVLVHPAEGPVKLMQMMGVSIDAFTWSGQEAFGPDQNRVSVQFIPVEHAPDIPSWGFLIDAAGDRFYYSGDANDVPEAILTQLTQGEIRRIYQDTASKDSAYHCAFTKLCRRIPPDCRQRVYCMHLDAAHDPDAIREAGFCLAGKEM